MLYVQYFVIYVGIQILLVLFELFSCNYVPYQIILIVFLNKEALIKKSCSISCIIPH